MNLLKFTSVTSVSKKPMLQGNILRSTKGIQLLPKLEELDLRYNLIASIHEVVRLSGALSSHELPRQQDESSSCRPVRSLCVQ